MEDDLVGEPLVEAAPGRRIAVAARLVARQIDVDDVVNVTLLEGVAFLGADDVVRRGDDPLDVDGVGVVAEAGERFEPGHAPMATRPAEPLRESHHSWSWIWKCWTSIIIGRR